jgi:hypothetical protein
MTCASEASDANPLVRDDIAEVPSYSLADQYHRPNLHGHDREIMIICMAQERHLTLADERPQTTRAVETIEVIMSVGSLAGWLS